MKTKEEIKEMIETMKENSRLTMNNVTKMVLLEKIGVLEWVLKTSKKVRVNK